VGVEVERGGKGEGWVELRRDLIGSEDGFVVEVLMYACMAKGELALRQHRWSYGVAIYHGRKMIDRYLARCIERRGCFHHFI
jgi:hypothetical protein